MSELDQKIDLIGKKIHDFQEANEAHKGEVTEGMKALADDSAKLIEEVNNLKTAKEKADEEIEKMSKLLYRDGGEKSNDTVKEEYKQALSLYLRKGTPIQEELVDRTVAKMVKEGMHGLTEKEYASEAKALQVQVNPDGGYFVMPELSAQRIQRVFETSPMRQVANVISTTSDRVEMIIDDNEASSGGWVGETESRPNTDTPQIGKLTINTHEQYAQPIATQKMIDDAGFDIEGWLQDQVRRKITRVENKSFVVGNGVAKPAGILSYSDWTSAGVYERNALERINSEDSTGFTYNGLVKLQGALKDDYQANSVFMMKRSSWTQVLLIKDGQDRPLISMDLLRQGDDRVLLGKRVIFADDVPAISANADSVIYGDFNAGYTIVDKIGFRVLRDQYTQKPYIKYYTTKFVGGAVTNYEALKIQKISV